MINIKESAQDNVKKWCKEIYDQMDFPSKYKGQASFKEDISKWIRENIVLYGIAWEDGNDSQLRNVLGF